MSDIDSAYYLGIQASNGQPKERSTRSRSDSNLERMETGVTKSNGHGRFISGETSSFISQVILPLLVAGVGMVFAGLLLDHTQDTVVFTSVSEIFILVPALLGLKGNLEMTMASRLSSIANMGLLKSSGQRTDALQSNIALTQAQSIIVGFCAALFASFINFLHTGAVNFTNIVFLGATSIATASLASLILGLLMMAVIVLSVLVDKRKFNVNPDNISTSIASLGDLLTLFLLYIISDRLYISLDYFPYLCPLLILGAFFLLLPLCVRIAVQNRHTKVAWAEGFTPVLSAMVISSFGGIILNRAVTRFRGIAVYQPLINGVGGNLAAIQANRMSTFLHMSNEKLSRSKSFSGWPNPITYLFRGDVHSRTAIILLCLVVPCQLFFLGALSFLHSSSTSTPLSVAFLSAYLFSSLVQVFLLLYLAEIIISWMWSRGTDPDNSAIPFLTAFGDLFGTLLLFLSFLTLSALNMASVN